MHIKIDHKRHSVIQKLKPTIKLYKRSLIKELQREKRNLLCAGDTMIKKVVPSGGGQCIAPRLVEACDFQIGKSGT